MGKAVPKIIKSRASQLIELYPDTFSKDYGKNKEFVSALDLPLAKSSINKITGCITRTINKEAN